MNIVNLRLFRYPLFFQKLNILNYSIPDYEDIIKKAFDFLHRNSRTPKKANHGARPCSSVMRRLRKKSYYRKGKEEITSDPSAEKME